MSNYTWTDKFHTRIQQHPLETWLLCPACGGSYTHFTHAITADQDRDPVAVNYRGNVTLADGFEFSVGRRPSFALVGFCEEGGHTFAISFVQSKGQTRIDVSHTDNPAVRERQDPDGLELWR